MWLVTRAGAHAPDPDGGVTLAACPDTPGRPVPWRWTVRLSPGSASTPAGRAVEVSHDPASVTVGRTDHRGEDLLFERDGGVVLVAVAVSGQYLVAHGTGPWQRRLAPGDVAVLEGDENEQVLLTASSPDAELCLVQLASTTGRPLRWVP
jgi:hypothetical protein